MNPTIFIWLIYALWLIQIVYLTVSAIGVKRDTQPHLGQSLGLTFAMIAAFLLPQAPTFQFVNYAPVSPALSTLGLVIYLVGAVVFVAARQTLGKNWSQTVSAKEDHELITTGPYRLVRHPMYSAGLLSCIGSAIVVGGPFVFLLILLGALFLYRVFAEDKLMEQQFPAEYPDYRKRTKALIPFVW